MKQENVVNLFGTLSSIAGYLCSFTPQGTSNGVELVTVPASHLAAVGRMIMWCVVSLTKEFFGTTS